MSGGSSLRRSRSTIGSTASTNFFVCADALRELARALVQIESRRHRR